MSHHPSPTRWLAGIALVVLSLFTGAGMALTSHGMTGDFLGRWLAGSAAVLVLTLLPVLLLGRLRPARPPSRQPVAVPRTTTTLTGLRP